jgi:hypothetical protein
VINLIGINEVNEIYYDHLKHLLNSPYSVGFIGGKPGASFYFLGYQGLLLISILLFCLIINL